MASALLWVTAMCIAVSHINPEAVPLSGQSATERLRDHSTPVAGQLTSQDAIRSTLFSRWKRSSTSGNESWHQLESLCYSFRPNLWPAGIHCSMTNTRTYTCNCENAALQLYANSTGRWEAQANKTAKVICAPPGGNGFPWRGPGMQCRAPKVGPSDNGPTATPCQLPRVRNARLIGDPYSNPDGSQLFAYTCRHGYRIRGNPYAYCRDGVVQAASFACEASACFDLVKGLQRMKTKFPHLVLLNASLVAHANETLHFGCTGAYELVDHGTMTCVERPSERDFRFDSDFPTCQVPAKCAVKHLVARSGAKAILIKGWARVANSRKLVVRPRQLKATQHVKNGEVVQLECRPRWKRVRKEKLLHGMATSVAKSDRIRVECRGRNSWQVHDEADSEDGKDVAKRLACWH